MNDSDKLDQILKMLADLDSRVTRLEESKGKGKGDDQSDEQSDQNEQDSGSESESQSDAESSDGEEQDGDSADSADAGSDSEADGNGDPSDESQDPPEDWDTPDPVENEFPEEPRKGKPQGGNASDEQEDDGNTCDALNCNICAGTSMRASVPWSDSGEPL
jgi:hypothetical protein